MPSLEDVYRKFGEASEAAQLLETELGNILLLVGAIDQKLLENPNSDKASSLYKNINRKTLGQLLKQLKCSTESVDHLEETLGCALEARNRLSHSFYRRHNFRRNSDEGRSIMLEDLETIHADILDAYKAVMLLSGIDLDNMACGDTPIDHLPM